MKPGFLTSEFWVTAGVQFVGILALFGVFTPDQATELNTNLPQMGALVNDIVINVSALFAMAVSCYRYISGRSAVKKAMARSGIKI